MSGCCPPDSAPYLSASHITQGQTTTIGDVEAYVTGSTSASKGILLIPDIFGWNGGRTRHIADLLSASNYYVVVPKILSPTLRGGTDGDGCPGDFTFPELKPWISQIPRTVLQPKLATIMSHFETHSITTIGVVGFCWGGWTAFHLSALYPNIKCGVIPHPSITIEKMIFDRPLEPLTENVRCPFLLMPAGNDPDIYKPGGEVFDILKRLHPASECIPFPDMVHGWVPRGDMSDAVVARDVAKTIEHMQRYLTTHL